jgi:hypothetical protein
MQYLCTDTFCCAVRTMRASCLYILSLFQYRAYASGLFYAYVRKPTAQSAQVIPVPSRIHSTPPPPWDACGKCVNGPVHTIWEIHQNLLRASAVRRLAVWPPMRARTANDSGIASNSPFKLLGCGRGCLVKLPAGGRPHKLAVGRYLAAITNIAGRNRLQCFIKHQVSLN